MTGSTAPQTTKLQSKWERKMHSRSVRPVNMWGILKPKKCHTKISQKHSWWRWIPAPRYEHTFKENLPDSSQPHGHTATLSATVSHAIQFILFYSDSILFYSNSNSNSIQFNSILFYFYSILVYSVYSIIIYICWSLALNKHETEVNRLKFRWVI